MGSTVFATVSTPGPAGPAGPAGPTGYSPQYIVMSGVPANTTGNNGDMYINSATADVYGPKAGGVWGGIACNIKGSPGPAGYAPQYIVAAGAPATGTGNNGDMYINSTTSDVYGPKTAGGWGAVVCNIRGAAGAQGPPGVAYTPKGQWLVGSTYAQGDEATNAGVLYISLQSSNTGNTPATSPAWWQPVASGGGLADPTTTQGDLIVRGVSPPPGRLGTGGAGSNGLVLTADSTQALGMRWGTVPSAYWQGGTGGIIYYTGGYVGIGQTNPIRILHVIGSGSGNTGNQITMQGYRAAFELMNAAANYNWYFGLDDADANKLKIGVGSSVQQGLVPTITVTGAQPGNVGIGTVNPAFPLMVHAAANENLGIGPAISVSGSVALSAVNDANTANVPLEIRASNAIFTCSIGIGTASPLTFIDLETATAGDVSLVTLGVPNATGNGAAINFAVANITAARIRSVYPATNNIGLAFHTFSASGIQESVRITGPGRVGIGTSTPGYQLDVAGGDVNVGAGYTYRINGTPISTGGGLTVMNIYSSGQRAFGTVYQNTTGKPMFISIICTTAATTGNGTVMAYCDATSGGTRVAMSTTTVTGTSTSDMTSLCFWALPNYYYKALSTSGANTMNSWIEWN